MARPLAADHIHIRLVEAAQTLRRLPIDARGAPADFKVAWPDIVQNQADAYGWYGDPGWLSPDGVDLIRPDQDARPQRGPPMRDEIDRMDETLMWLWQVDPAVWPLLWFKAMFPRRGFRTLARRVHANEKTLRRHWERALLDLAFEVSSKRL